MSVQWAEERISDDIIRYSGRMNYVSIGHVSVIVGRDGSVWMEAYSAVDKTIKAPVRNIEEGKEYVTNIAIEFVEEIQGTFSLVVDLTEPEYKCEQCSEIFNVFRYRNRNGRCNCGGQILHRYPHVRQDDVQEV